MAPMRLPTMSRNKIEQREWFEELPREAWLMIFARCRIDELLTLRLTHRKARDLIDGYMRSIAPEVAYHTFPTCTLLLRPLTDKSGYTLKWLKSLIPQQLATILIDRHRFSHDWTQERYGIPAEDPFGDELRARVANGWVVLRSLANISKEVYSMSSKDILPPKSRALSLVRPAKFKLELLRHREGLILKKRLDYIAGMPDCSARDYKLMFMLLSSAFRTTLTEKDQDYTPWVFDWGCGVDGQRLLRRGNSWLTWFILHEGPELFWQQWWCLPADDSATRNHVRDKSIAAWFGNSKICTEDFIRQLLPKDWADINQKVHSVQRDNAYEIQKAIEERVAASRSTVFNFVNPTRYFVQYAKRRDTIESSEDSPVEESLGHVPFHVDFRCPEELFNKFCMVTQKQDLRTTKQGENLA